MDIIIYFVNTIFLMIYKNFHNRTKKSFGKKKRNCYEKISKRIFNIYKISHVYTVLNITMKNQLKFS